MNDKLGKKNYAKFDRTYMAFGSIMNGLQGLIAVQKPIEAKAIIQSAWNTAKELTSEFVDDLYADTDNGNEEQPL